MAKITVTRERQYITEDTPSCNTNPPEEKSNWGAITAVGVGTPLALLFGPIGIVVGLFAGMIADEATKK